jgi:hypothetical protein
VNELPMFEGQEKNYRSPFGGNFLLFAIRLSEFPDSGEFDASGSRTSLGGDLRVGEEFY